MPPNSSAIPPEPRWPPRFTLTTILLISLVCCVTAAGGHYLVLGLSHGVPGRAMFVIAVLILPVLLVVSANLVHRVIRQQRRKARNQMRRDPD